MGIILKASGITKDFASEEKVLKGISLEIEENTFTAILGQSGSGKSTLLNILSGLLKPTGGKVWCRNEEITAMTEDELSDFRRNRIGVIFQNYLLLQNLTVRENIEIGRTPGQDSLPLMELAQLLEIQDLLGKFPAGLSGGQKQRTAIARAVIKKPDILYCDEATGALDEANGNKVVSLLHEMKRRYGLTVLFVTHNLQIAETADRIITIRDGLLWRDEEAEN